MMNSEGSSLSSILSFIAKEHAEIECSLKISLVWDHTSKHIKCLFCYLVLMLTCVCEHKI